MDISKFLVKLFGDKKSRDLKAYRPLVEMVTKAYPAVQALSTMSSVPALPQSKSRLQILPWTSRKRFRS